MILEQILSDVAYGIKMSNCNLKWTVNKTFSVTMSLVKELDGIWPATLTFLTGSPVGDLAWPEMAPEKWAGKKNRERCILNMLKLIKIQT